MLVRALKVLGYFLNEITRTDIDTAALDQPGDEGCAYGRARRIGNDEPRNPDSTITSRRPQQLRKAGKNDDISPIDRLFRRFHRDARLSTDLPLPSLLAVAAPVRRASAARPAAMTTLWNVLIITQAGSCDPAIQLAVPGLGRPDLVRGRRQGVRKRRPGRRRYGQDFGRRLGGVTAADVLGGSSGTGRWSARVIARRQLQRPLAGDARLTAQRSRKWPARSPDGPSSKFINAQNSARRSGGESARRQNHHDLTALETRVLLDLRDLRRRRS